MKKHASKYTMTALSLATSAALGAALSPTSFAAVSASSMRSGPVIVQGQTWRSVPYVTVGNTTFFGIWYLQQMLRDYGIQAGWDGKTLSLDAVPSIHGTDTMQVNGATGNKSLLLSYNGENYVDVNGMVAAGGGTASYNNTSRELVVQVPSGVSAVKLVGDVGAAQMPASTAHVAATSRQKTVPAVMAAGYVREDGKLWKSVPIVHRDGTTFFGVYYLQQWLKAHGIDSGWNGKTLSIAGLPRVVTDGEITYGGATKPAALVQFAGHWYASTSTLQSAGIQVTVDDTTQSVTYTLPSGSVTVVAGRLVNNAGQATAGQVAVQDGNGDVQVVTAQTDGSFTVHLSTLTGTIIGINTGDSGWIGQSVAIGAQGQNVQADDVERTSVVHGKVAFTGAQYPVHEISVRNVITHAHYYATIDADGTFSMTVPAGAYEAYALVTTSGAVYLAQPFTTTGDSTALVVRSGSLPSGSSYQTAHAVISKGDTKVTAEDMASVANLFEHVYGSTTRSTSLQPSGPMKITLYGTAAAYQKHFTDEGYTSDQSQQIADGSVAAEEGTDTISVLLPAYDSVDGMNILAHEFTHALIATVSQNIDSWANEGVAWTQGIAAEMDQSPDATLLQGEQWYQWVDIVAHQQQGDLLKLGDPNPLDGNYNIESQDYFAVHELMTQFGPDKFMAYVKKIDSDPNAFEDTFGETFDTFSQQVTAKLQASATQANTSFTVRVRVTAGGPKQLYVVNPAGQTQVLSGLQEGHVYSLVLGDAGTASASGLTAQPTQPLPVLQQGDWYIGTGGDGTVNRQEFEIEYQFGIPFLVQALLYGSDGNIQHAYPAVLVPNGLEIVDIKNN